MLKDITTITLQGANFASPTDISLFDPIDGDKIKTIKGALLYGRNGTGKSTIARAFRVLSGEVIPEISLARASDASGFVVTLVEDEKKRIFVFDEDYVNAKVKLKEDHLDTIVMLGAAADLADKIIQAEKERDDAKLILDSKKAAYDEYTDHNNLKSPTNRLWKIGNALRGDDAWAGRDREINAGRQNTQVRDDTYKKFVELKPEKKRSVLIIEYKEKLKELEAARSGSSKITAKVPSLPESYTQYDDAIIKGLLAAKIEKPELSDREKFLMSLVESGKAKELRQRADFFKQDYVASCPYCFQPIEIEYKNDLVSSIEKVLSKEVSDHQRALEEHINEEITVDISSFSGLNSYQTCIDLIGGINTSIREVNKKILQKIENPYKPIKAEEITVENDISALSEALVKLEEERRAYNKKLLILHQLKMN